LQVKKERQINFLKHNVIIVFEISLSSILTTQVWCLSSKALYDSKKSIRKNEELTCSSRLRNFCANSISKGIVESEDAALCTICWIRPLGVRSTTPSIWASTSAYHIKKKCASYFMLWLPAFYNVHLVTAPRLLTRGLRSSSCRMFSCFLYWSWTW
jgi:hypothetical protein